MKNNDIDKEKILSNADNADMETSVETPVETTMKTSGETPMETSVEHMLKSARDNPPKVPASLFDAVVADAIRLNPHTNKISNTPTNTRTNTPANLNTPDIRTGGACRVFVRGVYRWYRLFEQRGWRRDSNRSLGR